MLLKRIEHILGQMYFFHMSDTLHNKEECLYVYLENLCIIQLRAD